MCECVCGVARCLSLSFFCESVCFYLVVSLGLCVWVSLFLCVRWLSLSDRSIVACGLHHMKTFTLVLSMPLLLFLSLNMFFTAQTQNETSYARSLLLTHIVRITKRKLLLSSYIINERSMVCFKRLLLTGSEYINRNQCRQPFAFARDNENTLGAM